MGSLPDIFADTDLREELREEWAEWLSIEARGGARSQQRHNLEAQH